MLLSHIANATSPTEIADLLQRFCVTLQADFALAESVGKALKERSGQHCRDNPTLAREFAWLLVDLYRYTQDRSFLALRHAALGNVYILSHLSLDIARCHYEQAASIYADLNQSLDVAKVKVGYLGCLYLQGFYDDAIVVGTEIVQPLAEHGVWPSVVGVFGNVALIYHRLGDIRHALTLLDIQMFLCQREGLLAPMAGIWLNRAWFWQECGQLVQAIEANKQAEQLYEADGQTFSVYKARMNRAQTYGLLGEYQQALALFDEAHAFFYPDYAYYALFTDLLKVDLLLQLSRYEQVVEICERVADLYAQQGMGYTVAQARLSQVVGHVGLGEYGQAMEKLTHAEQLLTDEANRFAMQKVALERATLLFVQGDFALCQETALQAVETFSTSGSTLWVGQGYLLAARAAVKQANWLDAAHWAGEALVLASQQNVLHLLYEGAFILAEVAWLQGDGETAVSHYTHAINYLEQLRGNWFIELRADFLQDKSQIYKQMVAALLARGDVEKAFAYVERAKSRTLVELLAYQPYFDLTIQSQDPKDKPLIEAFEQALRQLNQYANQQTVEHPPEIRTLEAEVVRLREALLVRNGRYQRDLTLIAPHYEPMQHLLDEQTLLLEYFMLPDEQLMVFLVTREEKRPFILAPIQQIQPLLQRLPLRVGNVLATTNLAKTQKLLHHLYQQLIDPFAEMLKPFTHLIIVPHNVQKKLILQHLPFHALYDGTHYLAQTYQITYLPNATLLRYLPHKHPIHTVHTFGYSLEGKLPYATQEAQEVANLFGGTAHVESQATKKQLNMISEQADLLHLSTHGEFKSHAPLMSHLSMADGWLTTLDILNLRLNASLVVLSACETGKSAIEGGDELLGFMRAFLHAGAASLLMTLWPVEEQATLAFMCYFYQALLDGASKATALQAAQTKFLHHPTYKHPFYWSAFALVGANE